MDVERLEESLYAEGVYSRIYDYRGNSFRDLGERSAEVERLSTTINGELKNDNIPSELHGMFCLARNLYDTAVRADAVRRENDSVLERLTAGSRLVVGLHGLRQNSGSFIRFKKKLERGGFEFVGLDYDWRVPFKEFSGKVEEELIDMDVPCPVYALGHSTGADIFRYVFAGNTELAEKFSGLLLSAPVTNGKKPDLKDRFLFGNAVNYHNPENPESEEVLERFGQRLKIPYLVISAVWDSFVPLESSLDVSGVNVVLGGFGHLAGTGCSKSFNRAYFRCLEFLGVDI
ncbi:hypothetical protein GF386_06505 [Candidatus Pacearchaeota archaeon]|nr:hypothetical protein [Candidatus Pacearchaeota archaeon]MBD3283743.1 hypothetical protein [Candidatus Pacearchaeota archaeon]